MLIHVGFGNYLDKDRVVAIAVPASAPTKRSIQDARDNGMVIDLTGGRRTKSVVFTDTKALILSALEPKTLHSRVAAKEN